VARIVFVDRALAGPWHCAVDFWRNIHAPLELEIVFERRVERVECSHIFLIKIDYLKEGSDDCPMVRLYDFDSEDAKRMRRMFQALADGSIERVRLETVESIDGTQLTFVRSAPDGGVTETESKNFKVSLSSEG
jgi:hypothetical protein